MLRELRARGIRGPDGFAVTAEAHRDFLRDTGLAEEIRQLFAGLAVRTSATSQDPPDASRASTRRL